MLRIARVVASHPEDHSVDLVMVDDGSRHVGVQVLTPSASTTAGLADLPAPGAGGDKWSLASRKAQDVLAIAGMLEGSSIPVVLGFVFPQVNGVLFAENRRIMRHGSDVYTSIDGDGNLEVSHPSGTFVRIAETPEHEDLTGRDFDGNWRITNNTARPVHLRVEVQAAGARKFMLHVNPSGDVVVEHDGDLTVKTAGSATVEVGGSASVDVGGTTALVSAGAVSVDAPSVTLDTPQTTCTGNLTVQGLLTYQAGMAGSGGSGATLVGPMNVQGNVTTTGSLTNNGKDVGSGHRHSNSGGSGTGGAPI